MLTPLTSAPLPVAAVAEPNGFAGGFSGSIGIAQCYAPVLFNGATYICWMGVGDSSAFTPTGGIFVSKSTDNGVTWNVLDSANGPSRTPTQCMPDGGIYCDGNIITVVYSITAETITPTLGPIVFRDFDLSTETWGADYAVSGAPDCYSIQALWKRSTGEWIVLYNNTFSGGFIQGVVANTLVGSTWGTEFPVDTNIALGDIVVGDSSSVLDAGDRLHVFGVTQDLPGERLWYQLVLPDDSLGTFYPAIQENLTGNINGGGISRQCAVDMNVIGIGSMDSAGNDGSPVVIYGTPLDAPVFTISPPIDPLGPFPTAQTSNPSLSTFNGDWFATYYVTDPITLQWTIRALEAKQASGPWTPSNPPAIVQGASPYYFPSQLGTGITGSSLSVMAGFTPGFGGNPNFAMLAYAISPDFSLTGTIDSKALYSVALPNPLIVCCEESD